MLAWLAPRALVRWGVAVLLLGSGGSFAWAGQSRFTQADYQRHAAELRQRLPGPGFTVVIEPPFVIAGDEPAEVVRQHCQQTIRWAVERFKEAYFSADPTEIIDIWLFRDQESYARHCQALFGQTPKSPYGFFSPSDRALAINMATGGGSLVHEIVHAFMAANFPGCPPWFNEGLASLYEQATERGGAIVGLTNWRLAGLQRAIREKKLDSFHRLFTMDEREFYGDSQQTNYAQARYLCYYLQEQGLLRTFYHRFRANQKADPSGCRTLQEVLQLKDLEGFQRVWEAWVLGLRFPEGVRP